MQISIAQIYEHGGILHNCQQEVVHMYVTLFNYHQEVLQYT